MIIYDKAAWQIDGMIEPDVVISYFKRLFFWLDGKGLLSEEGKGVFASGIDDSISLHERLVTKEAINFLNSKYDAYLEKHFEDDENCEHLDTLYNEYTASFSKSNSLDIRVYPFDELCDYRFVVVFVRYQNKWLYCRAKERETFETVGGHIEKGETPLDAAKRELYEETGAVKYDIQPAFDYSVYRENNFSNGQVFLANVHELGEMPRFEMAEVKLFDTIPDKMRFPQILPVLFEKVSY